MLASKRSISAHRDMLRAEQRFQGLLEAEYGPDAGDMRYRTDEQPPHIQSAGREFVEACDEWRTIIREERKSAR